MRGVPTAPLLAAALLLAACTDGGSPGAAPSTAPAPSSPAHATGPGVVASSTLTCAASIDGGPPPADFTVVLGAVALPASPRYPALQAAPTLDLPKLFAKTGLVVRTGVASEIDVPGTIDPHVGIGWNNGPAGPGRRFVVPACPDARGTGWLSYPGGFWADAPLCLPLDVRVGSEFRRVEVGVGAACPGQPPPPTP